jgi:hypothetical protein
VREIKPLPEKVLPCSKHDKTTEWMDWEDFPYKVTTGWFHTEDLEEARAWLFKNGCAAKASYSHKAELRKLSAALPGGTLKVFQTPEALAECAALCAHFGETYRMGGLPATIGRIIQKALRPKREA